ncbi:MAG: hypothetical protein LW821_04190 [Flammeovirgaceae bacterium]|nr:hypothetical protein [Flammeovirgaceae bacterium]
MKIRKETIKIKMETNNQNIEVSRIFEELQNKANEVNPELIQKIQSFNQNSSLEIYRDFLYNSYEISVTHKTSNSVSN